MKLNKGRPLFSGEGGVEMGDKKLWPHPAQPGAVWVDDNTIAFYGADEAGKWALRKISADGTQTSLIDEDTTTHLAAGGGVLVASSPHGMRAYDTLGMRYDMPEMDLLDVSEGGLVAVIPKDGRENPRLFTNGLDATPLVVAMPKRVTVGRMARKELLGVFIAPPDVSLWGRGSFGVVKLRKELIGAIPLVAEGRTLLVEHDTNGVVVRYAENEKGQHIATNGAIYGLDAEFHAGRIVVTFSTGPDPTTATERPFFALTLEAIESGTFSVSKEPPPVAPSNEAQFTMIARILEKLLAQQERHHSFLIRMFGHEFDMATREREGQGARIDELLKLARADRGVVMRGITGRRGIILAPEEIEDGEIEAVTTDGSPRGDHSNL